MNGLNEMDCDDLAEMAAELALGVLTGRERAQAIMHLDRCHTCRERIRDLALTEEDSSGCCRAGHGLGCSFQTSLLILVAAPHFRLIVQEASQTSACRLT